MRKSLMIASALLLTTAAPAFAQDSGEVEITGSVADRCLFTTTSDTIELNELAADGTGASAGKLNADAVDGATATLKGWCNGTAATMSVKAVSLSNVDHTGTVPTGFDTVITFTASAEANNVTATDEDSTDIDGGDEVDVSLFTGDIDITLSDAATPDGGLLVAGDYEGQVHVTLTPNVSFNVPTTPAA